jgi:TolB-like protein
VTDPARWQRVESLFDRALELPRRERENFLASAAPDDVALREEVRRMLAAHDRTGPLDRRTVHLRSDDLRERLSRALADRYELDELLGSGGMSSVFRARELKHDRTIVIKVLQPGLAAAIGPARFEDEVRIAARLSHPHILALIDSGEADGLRYYVTPYVGGVTLRKRLDTDGALAINAAITMLRDIADALAHAHEAGVVHRDLKPDNVLCVGDHAFLLDFGVAKLDTTSQDALVTDPGIAIGTPGYMAPEQAAGGPVDHRADIYAWGLVAREILTGKRGPTARLGDRPDVPEALRALIEATLAIDPAERPTRARSLVAALDAMLAPIPRRRGNWQWAAAALLTGVGGWWLANRADAPISMDQLVQPIAVAPLIDESGDSTIAGLGRLAGDWITQGLHESGGLRVVAWPASRAAVAQATDGDIASALQRGTGAGTLVLGSIHSSGDSLQMQAEIVDARNRLVLTATTPVAVHRDSAIAGVRMLRDRLLGALAVHRDDRLPRGSSFATQPPTYAAYRLYDVALDDFNAYRYRDAYDGMLAAWRLDTTFTAALVSAAYAAWNTSAMPLADSLVKEVLLRRSSMSAYQVATTEVVAASLKGDVRSALEAALRAAAEAPGTRAGYNAALAFSNLDRPAEALAQLDSLDPEVGPMRGWPAYWSQRSYAHHQLGDHRAEIEDARTMAERHPGQRVALVIEARALGAMGALASLDSLIALAEPLPPDVYWSQGAMRIVAAEELLSHGYPEAAMRYFADGVRWLKQRLVVAPDNEDHSYWLLSSLWGQRHWREAMEVAEARYRQHPDRMRNRAAVAILASRLGDTARASSLLEKADPWDRGEWLLMRARNAAVQGRREEALALLTQALSTGVGSWHWRHGQVWHDFETVRDDPRFPMRLRTQSQSH